MKLYVGVTDKDWFYFLKEWNAVEMNFWRPRSTSGFTAIGPGELFLFKLKFPSNKIVGGAFLVRHTVLPLDLAWEVFGAANGCPSIEVFRHKISSIRNDTVANPHIGCTVLTSPFYLADDVAWLPPNDWSGNIVMGKSYDTAQGEGARLLAAAQNTLRSQNTSSETLIHEDEQRYGGEMMMRPRLGQGGFRVVVLENYGRRCAITGEKTLPVLEAGHIKPYVEHGPHEPANGLLLRSDLHTLFDRGYLTVTNDYRVEVSRRIRDEFSNGREYYARHGQRLQMLPSTITERPGKEYLEWHQTHKFLGS